MMSFKAFLGTQEDSITDEEAIKRYNEYKLEFRRQQLNEFFVAHKDEEWYISLFSDNGLKIISNTSCEAQPYLNVDIKIINFYSGSAVIPR